MTPEERQQAAIAACRHEDEGKDFAEAPLCPFLSKLVPNTRCFKAGGVCSTRKYKPSPDSVTGIAEENERVVTGCPLRFVVDDAIAGKSIFRWIAETMLDVSYPTIVKETPFLRKISDSIRAPEAALDMDAEAEDEGKKAGRIDWILVDPATMTAGELRWCAVETQAIYFSGDAMRDDFEAYVAAPKPVLFPIGRRRPDYRSNGPKRLSPQLDVKVPALGRWGKKVCVVVDRYFLGEMNQLADAYPHARDDKERRDNADVVWFIVDYDDQMRLRKHTVIYTTLDSTRRALNATAPLSKEQFTAQLKAVIEDGARANKVFKTVPVTIAPPTPIDPTASEPSALA